MMSVSSRNRLEEMAVDLLQETSQLARHIFRSTDTGLSRSEASILTTLETGPRRITELADLEGLAQPTVTALVARLEYRGWVRRAKDDKDGRVVLARLTEEGEEALSGFRATYRPLLAGCLAALSPEELDALEAARPAFAHLIDTLKERGKR
jgi:DNA-binding MarR family transcriptional regulator